MPLKCCWRYSRKIRLLRFTCTGIRGGLITLKNVERHSEPSVLLTPTRVEAGCLKRGGGCERCNVASEFTAERRSSEFRRVSIMKFRQDSIAATSVCSVDVPARGRGGWFCPDAFNWFVFAETPRRDPDDELDSYGRVSSPVRQSSKFQDRRSEMKPMIIFHVDRNENFSHCLLVDKKVWIFWR